MIYVGLLLLAAVIALRFLSPVRYAVHGSKAGPLPDGVHPEGRWMLGGFVHDEDGNYFDVTDKFIGHAVGNSMLCYGIPSGATFIGNYLNSDEEKRALPHGEMVVVDGVAEFSETGYRLRTIDRIEPDGTAHFLPDTYNRQPRNRPMTEITASVTHVIDNGRLGNGEWMGTILRSVRALPQKLFPWAA